MRKILFQIHLWTGLVLGVVFVLLGLSGSLLVYDHEILAIGEKPVPRVAGGPSLPIDTLLASARVVRPDRRMQATVQLPRDATEAVLVRLQKPGRGGPVTTIAVDPATARVLDVRTATPNPVFGFLHQFHGNLAFGRDGRQIVGWLGVGMLALGLSGIVLWWPKRGAWKAAFGVRKTARGYWFHRELHGAAGIWFWIVFVIVSFSGVVIVFPETVRSVASLGTAPPAAPIDLRRGVNVVPVKGAKPMGAGAAVELVQARYPQTAVRSITLPSRRTEALRVSLGSEDGPVSTAFVDSYRKTIVAVRNPPGAPLENFIAWQRPLHAGHGLGEVWRALVFLSGLLPAVFFVTGLTMWLKKRRVRLRTSKPDAPRASAV
jgi:uncharacterized iron-regulated membrane protein